MSGEDNGPPPSGSGVSPPVTTAAVAPPVTTTAVGAPGPGQAAVTTTAIATVPGTAAVSLPGVPLVTASNSGLGGGVSTTALLQSSISTPSAPPVDASMLANLIQSGLIPPLEMAALQNKLASLSMGGLNVPMPPLNVTPLPLFKTPAAIGSMDFSSLVQALPGIASQGVNQDAVLAVMQVLATEHRELMVSSKEAEIDKQVKLVTNPMSKRAVDHDLRLLECVSNVKKVLMKGANILVVTHSNLDAVNRALVLVLSGIQEVEDRCKSDHAKHLVAHKSNYGWKFVYGLEALEKTVGHIDVSTLRA